MRRDESSVFFCDKKKLEVNKNELISTLVLMIELNIGGRKMLATPMSTSDKAKEVGLL